MMKWLERQPDLRALPQALSDYLAGSPGSPGSHAESALHAEMPEEVRLLVHVSSLLGKHAPCCRVYMAVVILIELTASHQ